MVGVLVALGAVGLLVWRGMKRSLDPARHEESDRLRLHELRYGKRLSLDDAEDGLVLARRFNDVGSVKFFEAAVIRLRKRRTSV